MSRVQEILTELNMLITRDGDWDTPEMAEEVVNKALARERREENEACAKIADEHWPESGHVPSHPDAVSCPMSISILIRRRARQTKT